MNADLRNHLQTTIDSAHVVLFMKGTRSAPQCGFSAKVVQMLDTLVSDYVTVNVLDDPAVREGIKAFSSWPTIPQLYVGGKLVGGCDIVTDLFADGSLAQTLGVDAESVEPPAISVSSTAQAALASATAGSTEVIRLAVSPSFDHELMIGPRQGGDVLAAVNDDAMVIALDPMSARRADGITIDFVQTPKGKAFKIDNPNAPPTVKELSVEELKARLDAKDVLVLVDVRSPAERAIAHIDGSRLLDAEFAEELEELDKGTPLAFVCHHGIRSRGAAEHFRGLGFRQLYNVTGGIDAWSQRVDESVRRY